MRAALDPRPVDTLAPVQVSVILALESVLQAAGWILTCPRCAAEGHPALETDNSPEDPLWKIDCRCRRRRMTAAHQPLTPSGDLLQLATALLAPLSLAVRCPTPGCLLTPLTIMPTPDGLQVTCACGTYRFRHTARPPH